MSGLFSISVAEARGLVAVSADIDKLAVVMGCASTSVGLSPFYLSGQSAVAGEGYGDAVDTLCQIIEQPQPDGSSKKLPAALYTVPGTTAGSYGTIDVSGVTGTAVAAVHSASAPYITAEAYLRIVNGGFIGTDGITFVDSLDNGRNVSQVRGLGTATNYTIPKSNARFDFSPSTTDLTALNTLLNELKTDYAAHRVLTTGGVHGAADTTNIVTAANASSPATRVALANDLRAQIKAHMIFIAGGVHGAADTTDVITAPVSTDDSSALILALNIKAVYNAHIALTAGGVHGLADGTNPTTAPAPTAGAFAAGDVIKVRTFAPAPVGADLTAAFAALASASIDFRILVCEFPMTAALAAYITTGLATLRNVGKRVTVLARTRIPAAETSETDAAWNTSVAADFAAFTDSNINLRAAYGYITDAMSSNQYLRSNLAQWSADVVRVGRSEFPDVPADRRMANFTLVDSTGSLIGHDEGTRGSTTGLSNESLGNRFTCDQRYPDFARREEVFSTVPWVLYASDERIRNLPIRRIANAMEAVAVSAGISGLGGKLSYIKADPAVPGSQARLTASSRAAAHGVIWSALKKEFKGDIDNAEDAALDTGLVQVNPVVTVSGGNLLSLSVTLAPSVFGYLLSLSITLAVQE